MSNRLECFSSLKKLECWLLNNALGRYFLANERVFYHKIVADIFGYYSLQIGLPQINFLQGNKISNHYVIGSDIQCDLFFLPFASNSIDLIICPHVLEYTPHYHNILSECYRVLLPQGKLIITCFNKHSILGLTVKQHRDKIGNNMQPLSISTLKQQVHTLNFSIDCGKFFSYRLPTENRKLLAKLSWMDSAGDRWLPTFANIFALMLNKEVVSFTKPLLTAPNYCHSRNLCPER